MATTEASLVGVATVILVFLPALILNIMFFFMYGRRERLQIPAHYFLISLSVDNIISAIFWIFPTIMAQFGYVVHLNQPSPFNGYCRFQAVWLIFHQGLHMHTFCVLVFERVLKFWKPTLHTEIFYNDIVVIMALVIMWILELVPGLFHVMTWGEVIFQTEQYQCAYDDTKAPSRLNAMLTYVYLVPFLFTAICFIVVFVKYSELKNKIGVTPGFDDTVIEEDLVNGARRNVRNSDARNRGPSGMYGADDDSDEEDNYNALFAIYPEDVKDNDTRTRQRIYKYREREYDFTVTVLLFWICFMLLWLLYLIVNYMKVYDPLATLPSGFETAATFLGHFTIVLGPVMCWATNRRYRRHIRMACNCVDRPKEPKAEKIVFQPREEPIYRRGAGGPQLKNIHREGVDWD